MTLDEAVALSLVSDLSRVGLADRLRADDPVLLEEARALHDRALMERARAEAVGINVLPWNDSRFPAALLAIPDMPPVLWYRGCLEALCSPAVAVVGSRAASAVALETAERLGTDLAALGITARERSGARRRFLGRIAARSVRAERSPSSVPASTESIPVNTRRLPARSRTRGWSSANTRPGRPRWRFTSRCAIGSLAGCHAPSS